MNNTEFNEHLQFAANNENFISNVLWGWGYSAVSKSDIACYEPMKFDLLVFNEKKQTYFSAECKRDALAHLTGNLAVEFESNEKPSGISVSNSHFYFFTCDNVKYNNDFTTVDISTCDVYILNTNDLKQLVTGCKVVEGGYNNLSKFYLLPISKINQKAKKYSFTYNFVWDTDLEFYQKNILPKAQTKFKKYE